jgi:hypothetical protein
MLSQIGGILLTGACFVVLYVKRMWEESLFDWDQVTVEGQQFMERTEILCTSFDSQDTSCRYSS